MFKIKYKTSVILLSLISSLTFTACGYYSMGLYKNEYNQICVSENTKVNLHNLVKKVIDNTNNNYKFENHYNSYRDSYITFKDKKCFSNINDLKSYIDLYTSYTLEFNKNKYKNHLVKNEGILLNNVSIKDVFEYFNLINNTEYKYYDDNIFLKNAIKRLYTIEDLANYISQTTPFLLTYINLNDELIYKLSYKDSINFSRDDEVLNNLNRAREIIKDLNQKKALNKINDVIKEIENFN